MHYDRSVPTHMGVSVDRASLKGRIADEGLVVDSQGAYQDVAKQARYLLAGPPRDAPIPRRPMVDVNGYAVALESLHRIAGKDLVSCVVLVDEGSPRVPFRVELADPLGAEEAIATALVQFATRHPAPAG